MALKHYPFSNWLHVPAYLSGGQCLELSWNLKNSLMASGSTLLSLVPTVSVKWCNTKTSIATAMEDFNSGSQGMPWTQGFRLMRGAFGPWALLEVVSVTEGIM